MAITRRMTLASAERRILEALRDAGACIVQELPWHGVVGHVERIRTQVMRLLELGLVEDVGFEVDTVERYYRISRAGRDWLESASPGSWRRMCGSEQAVLAGKETFGRTRRPV